MGSGLEWIGVGVSERLKVGMCTPERDHRALKFWQHYVWFSLGTDNVTIATLNFCC